MIVDVETVGSRHDTEFASFYRREFDGQVRRAAVLLGSDTVAADVVHDVMAAMYRRWATIEQPGPYLNRAVINGCRNAARRATRHRRALPRLVGSEEVVATEVLDDLFDALPFNQRAAILLRFYAGMTNPEIAQALGCSVGSVGPWIARALKTMRKALQ